MPGAVMTAPTSEAADVWRRQAVIDIGSNSVRLVVFEGLMRAPLPVFNERVLCGIGRGLADSGMMGEENVRLALSTIRRFVAISREIGAGDPEMVATAAVREADNGPDFVRQVHEECGLAVRVLSGVEEARLSALGAVSAVPEADGVMGDLGGGSLELVALRRGDIGDSVTLPLGPLRLVGLTPEKRIETIDRALDDVAWLKRLKDKPMYAVGGAWRSLARIHMAQRDYPLRIVHQYRVARSDANTLARVIGGLSPDSLAQIEGVNKRRLEALPGAATVLSRLLGRIKPGKIIFLAGGLREGLIQERLPDHVRREDPLIAQCRVFAARAARFGDAGDEVADWMARLFSEESRDHARLRLAACLLADVAWRSHPSYRAAQAFEQIFHAPVVGIDHPGRAFVALAVHARYEGAGDGAVTVPARTLVDEETVAQAQRVGLCLRLGLTLSAGAPGVLSRTRLGICGSDLVLTMGPDDARLHSELIDRRLASLARNLELLPRFEIEGS